MKHHIKRVYNSITSRQRNRTLDQKMLEFSVSLSSKHLEHCHVFSDRQSLISSFPQNAVVAEIGVACGDFSADILGLTKPKTLILIDAWAMNHPDYGEGGYQRVKERFHHELELGRIQIRRGYSCNKLSELEDQSIDWVYIDAAHDYHSVKNDLNIAFRKVKNGGIISGHDYHRWGRFGKRFGVLEAVNEFCVQYDLSFIGISLENNLNWSYALKICK